ncbi:uncharacterized protein BDV14DRAFT_210621 [Aspergillus stella-maris]|uniref:uncharacterized protein n=1 Tax=Aspergillus stella-maris TaxID=1810926 RepID=UPI003CCD11BD
MDPFDKLPPELIQLILTQADDFVGVESLLSVSPRVAAVLQARPTILHDLLSSNPITTLPHIRRLCYGIIHLNTMHCSDFDSYLRVDETPKIEYTDALAIILLGARVQRLACACLSRMKQRFMSTLRRVPAATQSGADLANNASRPFSWMEEYRVYSSLWHLQHYSTLRKTASERWDWSTGLLDSLAWYTHYHGLNGFTDERIWTVAAILADMGLEPIYGHNPAQIQHVPVALEREGEMPLPFFESFDLPSSPNATSENTVDTAAPLRLSTQSNVPVWSSPPIPENNKVSEAWHLSPEFCTWEQRHVEDFRTKATVMPNRPKGTDILSYFRPWRRMGLVIWDSWRMYTVGLCLLRGTERTPTPDGEFLEAGPPGIGGLDMTSRWLALAREGLDSNATFYSLSM